MMRKKRLHASKSVIHGIKTGGAFIEETVRAIAAEDFVAQYLNGEDAVELLRNLDFYGRAWSAAVALACFRKLITAAHPLEKSDEAVLPEGRLR